jgi:flagellar assembly factor FliW
MAVYDENVATFYVTTFQDASPVMNRISASKSASLQWVNPFYLRADLCDSSILCHDRIRF